jgi:hypothetical protein
MCKEENRNIMKKSSAAGMPLLPFKDQIIYIPFRILLRRHCRTSYPTHFG